MQKVEIAGACPARQNRAAAKPQGQDPARGGCSPTGI